VIVVMVEKLRLTRATGAWWIAARCAAGLLAFGACAGADAPPWAVVDSAGVTLTSNRGAGAPRSAPSYATDRDGVRARPV
jgi:hypothetical protein